MNTTVDFQNEIDAPVEINRLEQAIQITLERFAGHALRAGIPADDLELAVVITTDEQVQQLNVEFRQVDAPTDILSFPADPLPIEFSDEPYYLGDLIIAYPYALAQATRLGHDPLENLCLLVIHGCLHLLGYDHDTVENRRKMWEAQAEILQALNISTAIVPELESAPHE